MGWYSCVARISWSISGKLWSSFLRAAAARFSGSLASFWEKASSASLLLSYLLSAVPPSLKTVMVDGPSAVVTSLSASALGVVSTCEAVKRRSRPLGADMVVAVVRRLQDVDAAVGGNVAAYAVLEDRAEVTAEGGSLILVAADADADAVGFFSGKSIVTVVNRWEMLCGRRRSCWVDVVMVIVFEDSVHYRRPPTSERTPS